MSTKVPADGAARFIRPMLLGAIVLVLCQASIGMAVNLYVTVPRRHPGARPSNYFSGSYRSVTWAIAHGAATLAIHATLGLVLVIAVIGVAIHAIRVRRTAVAIWSVLGGLFVVGAGFNGSSFLDFNDNISSLIMALLGFASIACYATALFVLGTSSDETGSRRRVRGG
jgi:hypothetical protein